MDFEKAALPTKNWTRLDDALARPARTARRLAGTSRVILQRGGRQSISVYEVRGGRIAEPFELSFVTLAGDPRSRTAPASRLEPNGLVEPNQCDSERSEDLSSPLRVPSQC